MAVLVVGVTSVQADEALVWKLAEGDSLRYQVSNAMEMTSSVGGLLDNMTLTQAMDMEWSVASTLRNAAVVNQVIRRIVVELSPNGTDKFLFDSASQEVSDNRIVRSLANVFRKIVDQKFVVTMNETGKVTDVQIPNNLLQALRSAAAGSPGALDEKSLRQMMSQASVVLPKGEVAAGHQWTSKQKVELQFATMEMNPQMTYEGLNDDGHAVIDYVPDVTLIPNPEAAVQLTLSKSSGDGQVIFDPLRGRVVSMVLNLNMEMKATTNGQTNTQTIRQRTEMKLADTPDR